MPVIVYQLENNESTEVTFTKYTAEQAIQETQLFVDEFPGEEGEEPLPLRAVIIGEFFESGAPGSTYTNAAFLYDDGRTVCQFPPGSTTLLVAITSDEFSQE